MYNDLAPELRIKLFYFNLNTIYEELVSAKEVSGILSRLLENIVKYLNIESACFYLILKRKVTLISAFGDILAADELQLSSEDEKKLIATNFVLEEEELSYYPSLSILTSHAMKTKKLITLDYNNNLLGFITLGKKINGEKYEESENIILAMIANFTSRIIFYSNSYIEASGKTSDELYMKNITDTLSGTYISSYIEQRMHEGIKEAIRYKKPYSLSLLTIDNFDELRKKFGQQAINTLLQNAGALIRNLLRKDVDLAGRYNENSFLILLPSTERKGAVIFSERLKSRLSYLKIERHSEVDITLSVGVSSLEASDKNKDHLFNKVKEAVEYSTRKGGNTLSYNYEGMITENLSDFEKATGMSSKMVKSAVEGNFYLTDENGNEITFGQQSHWINIPKKH